MPERLSIPPDDLRRPNGTRLSVGKYPEAAFWTRLHCVIANVQYSGCSCVIFKFHIISFPPGLPRAYSIFVRPRKWSILFHHLQIILHAGLSRQNIVLHPPAEHIFCGCPHSPRTIQLTPPLSFLQHPLKGVQV